MDKMMDYSKGIAPQYMPKSPEPEPKHVQLPQAMISNDINIDNSPPSL